MIKKLYRGISLSNSNNVNTNNITNIFCKSQRRGILYSLSVCSSPTDIKEEWLDKRYKVVESIEMCQKLFFFEF